MVSTGKLSVTLVARLQFNPAGVDPESERTTTPANPVVACSLTVDVPCELASIRAGLAAPADIEKSATVNVNVLE